MASADYAWFRHKQAFGLVRNERDPGAGVEAVRCMDSDRRIDPVVYDLEYIALPYPSQSPDLRN